LKPIPGLLAVALVVAVGGAAALRLTGPEWPLPWRAAPVTPDTSSGFLGSDGFEALVAGAGTFTNVAGEQGTFHAYLRAAPARMELLEGVETPVYAYNGGVPGPTLEVREGDRVVIRFRNDLPEPTTVHWHGLHLPVDSDGSPFDPIAPGEEREYVFTIPPGSAGTYWYHPHPHHYTGRQVGRGLYGAIIVRADDDPLPSTLTERLLILSDNRFREDGSFDIADPTTLQGRIDAENGREGDVLFVNGRVLPTLEIRSGEVQRWRVVNASAARTYRLAIPGHSLLHVGSDGGLFEVPVEVDEIVVASAERVELLVRGTGAPGTSVSLLTLPYDRYVPQTRPLDWDEPREVLTLSYTADPPAVPPTLPATLRPIPEIDPAEATATRLVVMSQGFLNNRPMDMDRIDIESVLGSTEIWEIQNIVGMDHPFHLHGFQFQVIDRNGVPEPYRSWKDTVNVPKHETVRFVVRFENHAGRWMYHCHILDHEDQGMMGVLSINHGGES
jgi:FtsP/CotA-like multicopper oxidase with cupredoxin domain